MNLLCRCCRSNSEYVTVFLDNSKNIEYQYTRYEMYMLCYYDKHLIATQNLKLDGIMDSIEIPTTCNKIIIYCKNSKDSVIVQELDFNFEEFEIIEINKILTKQLSNLNKQQEELKL